MERRRAEVLLELELLVVVMAARLLASTSGLHNRWVKCRGMWAWSWGMPCEGAVYVGRGGELAAAWAGEVGAGEEAVAGAGKVGRERWGRERWGRGRERWGAAAPGRGAAEGVGTQQRTVKGWVPS